MTYSKFYTKAASGEQIITPDEAFGDYFRSQRGCGDLFDYQRLELPSGVILHVAETRALQPFSLQLGSNEDQVRAMGLHARQQRLATKKLQGIQGFDSENMKPFYCALWVALRPAIEISPMISPEKKYNLYQGLVCLQDCQLYGFEMKDLPKDEADKAVVNQIGRLFTNTFRPTKTVYPSPSA